MATPEEYLKNVQNLEVAVRQDTIVKSVNQLPLDKKTEAIITAGKALSEEAKQAVVSALSLPPPTQNVTDNIWLLVVGVFVFVLAGAFITMAGSLFQWQKIDDKLITIFTTVSAFLAGLLAPSPASRK